MLFRLVFEVECFPQLSWIFDRSVEVKDSVRNHVEDVPSAQPGVLRANLPLFGELLQKLLLLCSGLLAFFDHGDNFDFLAQNRLFKLHLIYVFPSGQTGVDTNFEALALYLTKSDGFPNVPADTRNALAAYVDRIAAIESGTVVKPVASYETMCRNYCNALQETDIYYCASVGRDCRDEVLGWGDLCYQERCATMQVTQSLCFQQCATAASLYDTVCSAGNAPAPLCPEPAADHDRACVDGCALPSGS